ncbi:glycosyltransferase family 2 protein [Haloglomus litoreum]|uniref:glycosyltransferase family 2 protein n=1 Tax=Haloglomus litoreum TaxID=3034026 RepID=UPI0023E79E19|nr:glycosyltransferase [Haloglomus sp. DT116]
MSDAPRLEVAMPTHESAAVIEGALAHLRRSEAACEPTVERLLVVDDESDDDTVDLARQAANEAGWGFEAIIEPCSLPEARERAIAAVEADWFLFLDDDVRVRESYLDDLFGAVGPLVGGVQGRKGTRTEHPTDWVRRRARRGGTHASLVRTEAARGVDFPDDLHVLEDEWLRRHVDAGGWLWVLNHRARFDHDSMERHPIGWQEGYLGGKYGLSTIQDVALNVPFALATGRSPLPHAKRTAGWLRGYLDRERGRAPSAELPE